MPNRTLQLFAVAALAALSAPAPVHAQALPEAPKPQPAALQTAFTPTALPNSQTLHIARYDVRQPTAVPFRVSLDEAIGLSIQNNVQAIVSAQDQRILAGLKLTALNALIPQLSFDGQTSTQEINLAAMGFKPSVVAPLLPPGATLQTIVKVDTTSAQVNLSQQLFNLPAFEIYKASKSTVQVATWNALLVEGDLVQRTGTQYLRALADVDDIANAQSQLLADSELLRQAREKDQAGVGTHLDALRAQVQVQNRTQELIKAQNNYDEDRIRLNRLMGTPADQELELTDAVPFHDLDQLAVPDAMKLADAHRKDLLSLQSQLRSTELQGRAVRYERLPTVAVGGFYGVIGETHGLYHGNFIAQAGLDFPIFQEAQIRGDKQTIEAQRMHLRQQIESLHDDIEEQIRSSKLDVDTYTQLVSVARSNVDLSLQILNDSQDRYRAGVDDDLPVVRAQATLAAAQSQLVESMFQFNQAKLQLARSVGVVETQFHNYLGQ